MSFLPQFERRRVPKAREDDTLFAAQTVALFLKEYSYPSAYDLS